MEMKDLDAAFKMRKVISDIAENVINKIRPESRLATVQTVNPMGRTATVLFAGETDPVTVRYSRTFGPNAGDLVKAYLRNGYYWIDEILEQPKWGAIETDVQLYRPRLIGGLFGSTDLGVTYGLDAYNTAVSVGDCLYLGSFKNSNSLLLSKARVEMEWNAGFFANQFTRWVFYWQADDPDGIWKVVLPVEQSGIGSGNSHQLEARATGNQLELRLRRKYDGGGTFGGMGEGTLEFRGNQIERDQGVAWNTPVSDTEPTAVFGDIATNNLEVNSTMWRGPYYDSEKYIVQSRVQENLQGGGIISWDSRYLAWSQPFRAHVGVHEFATQGYIDIAMPGDGTVITHHGAINSNQTVGSGVAGRIDMRNGGEVQTTLYYDPPMRGTGATQAGRFHLVGTSVNRFLVPSHWIMIATVDSRGVTTSVGIASLKIGTGREVDHWRTPTLQNSWVVYGSGEVDPGFKCENGRVYVRGTVKNGTLGTGFTIFTLPAGYRPVGNTAIAMHVNAVTTGAPSTGTAHTHPINYPALRGQIGSSGTIQVINNTPTNVFLQFDHSFEPGA